MKTQIRVAAVLAALAISGYAAAQPAPSDAQKQTVGLVLSGGGSKGIAHIGIIKALEDNDIPIDYITGTSMGAIIGGLYASGYSTQEMLDLILSKPFTYWSTGQIDPDLVYYFATEQPSPTIAKVPLPLKGDSARQAQSAVPASLINPMPMSFAFMELFSGVTAQCGGDFDKLFVPYRCVASDAAAKHKVVLSNGNVGDAVRASMSFPIVFQPTQVDSMLLYDGGIYDNFPVDVMISTFHPDIIIGVNVTAAPKNEPKTSLMDQLETLVIQNRDYSLPADEGIKINIDLQEFSLLDFPKAQAIYDIGYAKGMEMIDSIKGRVTSRRPTEVVEARRAEFKANTPTVKFDNVEVTGGTPKQNAYLKYLFTGNKSAPISLDRARRAYYRAISPGKLREFAPQAKYNDSTGMYSLALKASVKDNLSAGVGGYLTSSTTSYIYLSAGYSTLSFSSISTNLGAWLGQSYLGGALNSRVYLRTGVPSALEAQVVAFRQKYYESDYLFFEDKAPSYILDNEFFARLKWSWAIGSLCDIEGGVGYGILKDSFYQPDTNLGYLSDRDRCRFNLWQAYLKFESNTLDNINFPTQGKYYRLTGMAVTGDYTQNYGMTRSIFKSSPRWLQFEGVVRDYFPIGRHFSIGTEADIMLSTRKLLNDFNASIVNAPSYLPTPSSYNSFNSAFHANQFIAVGLAPIYKYNDNLSARIQGYCFLPMRKIIEGTHGEALYKGEWCTDPEFFSEFDICYSLPFATVTAYCNYTSAPTGNWNVGISFGVFMPAPRFLR